MKKCPKFCFKEIFVGKAFCFVKFSSYSRAKYTAKHLIPASSCTSKPKIDDIRNLQKNGILAFCGPYNFS
jgi:hypothetical protein